MDFDFLFVNPQINRVIPIQQRLRASGALAKRPETAYMADSLVRATRREILENRPHRIRPYEAVPFLSASFDELETAKEWRRQINQQLSLVKALAVVGKTIDKVEADNLTNNITK